MEHVTTLMRWVMNLSSHLGMNGGNEQLFVTTVSVAIILCFALGVYYLLTCCVAPLLLRLVERTPVKWDDELLNPKVVKIVSELIVVIVCDIFLPDALVFYSALQLWVMSILRVLVVVFAVCAINQVIIAIYNVICEETHLPAQSLKGIRQMIQLIFFIIAAIIVVSILINKSPVIILSGIGASAAVLMLVFKDTLLGLVAGIQLTVNDMLKPGDWIAAPKYGINGTVLDVTLTTVKVQNFDMTIVTVPPYLLVSESFQNWRGMQESGGRRITRSLCIDSTSIRFLSSEETKQFEKQEWFGGIKGGEIVNLSLFRRWLEHYVKNLPTTVEGMTAIVRELQPTNEGVPVEMYFFTNDTDWVNYEHLQADVVDYVVAMLSKFDLSLYQSPSSRDMQRLAKRAE